MSGAVAIDYTNWKGARRIRRILPLAIWFGATEWHKEEQWLLHAIDLEADTEAKDFAMKDIHGWRPTINLASPDTERAPGRDPQTQRGDDESEQKLDDPTHGDRSAS